MSTSSIQPGLVSITFRKLTPQRVVELAAACELAAIEWGGDVHVPHGDVQTAKAVKKLTADAGLAVSAYGSYYRLGAGGSPSFESVLETAIALEAPTIRVWAGTAGSAETDDATRQRITEDLAAVAAFAARSNVGIVLEYHAQTLTDTPQSTLKLLAEGGSNNVCTLWQPRHFTSVEQSLADIDLLRPHLGSVHVFHWLPTPSDRLPLSEGADRWQAYLKSLNDGPQRYASLEFVRGDDEDQLKADAQALHAMLAGL